MRPRRRGDGGSAQSSDVGANAVSVAVARGDLRQLLGERRGALAEAWFAPRGAP